MQYNILSGAIWDVNTTDGNTDIPFYELSDIVDYSDTPVTTLSGANTLVLDFDLGVRLHISRIEYKFETSEATQAAVASGIVFSYKDESFDTSFTDLPTQLAVDPNTYYATITGSVWAPRVLRLTHTVSGTYGATVTSGSIYGVRAYNNDDVIDFGTDGSLTQSNIEVGRGQGADTRAIPIYNDGSSTADALVNVEPLFNNMDSYISISTSESGPWTYVLDSSQTVFDSTDYDYGLYSNTESTYGYIALDGWLDASLNYTSKYSSGTYTTKIFSKADVSQMRLLIESVSTAGGRIAVDRDDPNDTIEVRSSTYYPADYSILREIFSSGSYDFYYRDIYASTGGVRYESASSFLSVDDYLYRYHCVIDKETDRWAGWLVTTGGYSQLYIYNNIDTTYNTKLLSTQTNENTPVNMVWKELRLEASGGMWIYFYCQGYSSSHWCDQTGYYLAYFDSSMSEVFKYYTASSQIDYFDVDYANGYCWYINTSSVGIFKVNYQGTVLVSFSDADLEDNFAGIAVMSGEQGVWFGNGTSLYRLSANGTLLDDYTISGIVTDEFKYIVLDGDGTEALWILDGSTLGYLYVSGDRKGTYGFRVDIDQPLRLESTAQGCWVYCVDPDNEGVSYMKFVSKADKRVVYSYQPTGASRPAPHEITFDEEDYAGKMPLAVDSVWSTLPWNKVAIESYLSPEDTYFQARITLRREEPVERYSFVTSEDQDYIEGDTFPATSATPNQLLWGDWLYKDVGDGLNRVEVSTTGSGLIMHEDSLSTQHAYINTSNRLITAMGTSSSELDVRVHYVIGDGDTGSPTGTAENLWLYGYAVDDGKVGNYIGALLWMPSDMSGYSRIYSIQSTVSSLYNTIGTYAYNYYEGVLRVYCKSDGNMQGAVSAHDSGSFAYGDNRSGWMTNGTKWYWKIVSDKAGSQVRITKFEIIDGDNYFYTDSPRINTLYSQDLVEVSDIPAGGYKNIYLNTDVPNDSTLTNSYETDLKVRWRIPTT